MTRAPLLGAPIPHHQSLCHGGAPADSVPKERILPSPVLEFRRSFEVGLSLSKPAQGWAPQFTVATPIDLHGASSVVMPIGHMEREERPGRCSSPGHLTARAREEERSSTRWEPAVIRDHPAAPTKTQRQGEHSSPGIEGQDSPALLAAANGWHSGPPGGPHGLVGGFVGPVSSPHPVSRWGTTVALA